MSAQSLRRQLFRSHLLVMFVAVGVMGATLILGVFVISAVVGEPIEFGRGGETTKGDRDALGGLFMLAVMGAAVGAASIVGWRMARRLARPMEALGDATRELAGGRYEVSVAPAGVEELDRLGEDMRELADALAETESRRLRLIGDIAHELRTPLSTIEGSMEALMDGVIAADDETFAGIAREASRLRRLANDLSALSASAEHGLAGDAGPVDLAAIATAVVDLLGIQADSKHLDLHLSATPGAFVTGDPDRLTQVLTNVVGNAIQYTESGRIDVDVSVVDGAVRATIVDTGRGLEPDDLTRVFDRFHRVDEHFADGTGVGLTIARQIVWAHGGTISATSAGLGHGTTLVIELPLR